MKTNVELSTSEIKMAKYRRGYLIVIVSACLFSISNDSHGAGYSFQVIDTILPQVGVPCPDFSLTKVTHFTKDQVTRDDFKGKWLFMEFWFTGCTTCILSLPKINEFQREFQGKAQFLMIGQNDSKFNKNIEEVYEKLRVKQNLNLASAYDSVLAIKWGVRSMPHTVIVDPQGIVRYITSSSALTKEKIERMLMGENVSLYRKDVKSKEFDPLTLTATDNKDNWVYQSILTKWNGEAQYVGYEVDRFATIRDRDKGFKLAMVNLQWLYQTAYFGRHYVRIIPDTAVYGKISQHPILEIQDTSAFVYDYKNERGKGLYNYFLLLPMEQVTRENIMSSMQQDLKRTFGYQAAVEVRDVPIWKLVTLPGQGKKLRSKGGTPYSSAHAESIAAGFELKNMPMGTFMALAFYYLNETERDPFINYTDIKGNIDIKFQADLTSLDDVRRELRKHGMELVRSTKKMQVVVIRDP